MQQHDKFSFELNGPTLNVHKVDHFDGLVGGLYCRILIAQNGLWYAELDTPSEQDYDEYFHKALETACILVGSTVYEHTDLALVAISPQLGANRAVVSAGGIYTFTASGHLFPMQISGAMYQQPAGQMNYQGPMQHHRNSVLVDIGAKNEMERLLRQAMHVLWNMCQEFSGFNTRPSTFTTNDPEQHRFNMSDDQRNQQEIG